MEVISSNDECSGHLRRDNTAGEDTATDRDVTGEGALLVWSVDIAPDMSTGNVRVISVTNVPM